MLSINMRIVQGQVVQPDGTCSKIKNAFINHRSLKDIEINTSTEVFIVKETHIA